MKLLILSDCHFEHMRDGGAAFCQRYDSFTDYDVAVIAGDLCDFKSIARSVRLVSRAFRDNVILVGGNHECYGSSVDEAQEQLENSCASTNEGEATTAAVHFLERSAVTIGLTGGQRFVGATLWFPMDHEAMKLTWTMNDFRLIDNLAQVVNRIHERTKEYVWDTLTKDDVLVTHHLPSWRSVHPKYAGSNINRFFVGDIESLIRDRQPKLIAHGHTHESCDHMIGETRVICNPLGYWDHEVNPNFVERLVVEV